MHRCCARGTGLRDRRTLLNEPPPLPTVGGGIIMACRREHKRRRRYRLLRWTVSGSRQVTWKRNERHLSRKTWNLQSVPAAAVQIKHFVSVAVDFNTPGRLSVCHSVRAVKQLYFYRKEMIWCGVATTHGTLYNSIAIIGCHATTWVTPVTSKSVHDDLT